MGPRGGPHPMGPMGPHMGPDGMMGMRGPRGPMGPDGAPMMMGGPRGMMDPRMMEGREESNNGYILNLFNVLADRFKVVL